jgi:TPR repeat protein
MLDDLEASRAMNDPSVVAAQAAFDKARRGDSQARAQFRDMVPRLEEIAATDDGEAHALLGGYYLESVKNGAAAIEHLTVSAERGNAAGMRGLGHMLVIGKDVQLNPKRAAELFDKAAAKGDAVAAYNLGIMHLGGLSTRHDEELACDCSRRHPTRGWRRPTLSWATSTVRRES